MNPVEPNFKNLHNQMQEVLTNKALDLTNVEVAFADKSDAELRQMYRLFRFMNNPSLVNLGSRLGEWAVKYRLPFAETITKKTIFPQFCGGTSLDNSVQAIERLYERNILSILDYGAEAKESEADFDATMRENLRAIDFAHEQASAPVISTKVSGLASNALLEKLHLRETLTTAETTAWERVQQRVDTICAKAASQQVGVYIDAEESWIQQPIDDLVDQMSAKYNTARATVFGTYQMYRHDRLAKLQADFETARAGSYLLGAKLVRGAYLEKERQRAKELGYPDPTQPNKAATDADYNAGIRFCVQHYEQIASCNASHNVQSVRLQADLIHTMNVANDHPHLNFCQLYGMSDYLTFNLAKAGYNVAKYMVYGPVRDVVPYLVRRAQENTSVTGDMSRELGLIKKELDRRGL